MDVRSYFPLTFTRAVTDTVGPLPLTILHVHVQVSRALVNILYRLFVPPGEGCCLVTNASCIL